MLWRIHLRRNTAKSKSGLSLWRTLQTNSKNVFFVLMFVATQLARQLRHFHRKKNWGNQKVIDFDLILAMTVTWPPRPPRTPWGGTSDSLHMWFYGGHLSIWLDKLTCQVPLVTKTQVIFLGLLLSDFFGSLIHEKNPKTLNSIYCTRMQLWTCRGHIRNRQNVPRSFITWGRFALRRSQDCF